MSGSGVPGGGVPGSGTGSSGDRWYDEDAGPLVRLFALTRGRTPASARGFDLISLVSTVDPARGPAPVRRFPEEREQAAAAVGPEAARILDLCSRRPVSVAELAADLDLPLGVVRILLADLLDSGLIRVRRPVPPAQLTDERVLREVIHGLRAL